MLVLNIELIVELADPTLMDESIMRCLAWLLHRRVAILCFLKLKVAGLWLLLSKLDNITREN